MSGHLVQAIVADPPVPERVVRPQVTQAPLAGSVAPSVPVSEPVAETPSQTAATDTPAVAPVVPVAPAPQAPVAAQPPAVAPAPPVMAQPAPAQPADKEAAPAQTPALPPAQPPAAMLAMPVEQLAAIGVGVIGGLIVLDSIGVPTAAAAFLGGLAGQVWYSNTAAPATDYPLTQRITSRLWHDAAIRDGEAMNRRWLDKVNDGRGG